MPRINENHFLTNGGFSNYEDTVTLPRHRWYYYKEGFSPLLVDRAIDEVGLAANDVILDPFNGSGTTTLAASIRGYKSYGIEVNPFTSFLSETKLTSADEQAIKGIKGRLISSVEKGGASNLNGFSTFSRKGNKKWLFNNSILKAFEGGWEFADSISPYNLKRLIRFSLIESAMQNCNAKRDGKCLRYRKTWKENAFDRTTFIESLSQNLEMIVEDISKQDILKKGVIINSDARTELEDNHQLEPFKLCITSPPYLNTFDYTDIYRPELFLGKFVKTQKQLRLLRQHTVRSHIQTDWEHPTMDDFGMLYNQSIQHLEDHEEELMSPKIPLMVQAYFEDMHNILVSLRRKAARGAQLWLVVSNSAYANKEIPVDLIIGDIGAQAGWYLREVAVLRYIQRRKTQYSPDINSLRESVIVFSTSRR